MKRLWAVSVLAVFFVLSGCATTKQKPSTVGEKIGHGIDWTITKASQGVQALLNRRD